MPSDYAAIAKKNRIRYGPPPPWYDFLLTGRYAERTHFIFEILQNAEDALARRAGSVESRTVTFSVENDSLKISHYGDLFNEEDVRSICRIGDSAKDVTEIGEFGIGFKSVYAFTQRPEVHSGEERFAITDFAIPTAIKPVKLDPNETLFVLPFNNPDVSPQAARNEIMSKLANLDIQSLLFLQEIDEIRWKADSGQQGRYWKKTQKLDTPARKIRLCSTNTESEDWLVFSRPVVRDGAEHGHVQIAYLLEVDEDTDQFSIVDAFNARIFSFFPTISTSLTFLIQGPYRTTPSRDNIPPDDEWNGYLITETARLLRESILWLRDRDLLTADILNNLLNNLLLGIRQKSTRKPPLWDPIERSAMRIIQHDRVLPKQNGGYVSVENGKLGTEDIRGFLEPSKLTAIIGSETPQFWMSDTIGQYTTRNLHAFLTDVCELILMDPRWLLRSLTETFLEQQPDEWIQGLYAFLFRRRLAKADLANAPLVRLADGRHVQARQTDGSPSAYLPGGQPTNFPTVRENVCQDEDAVAFLKELGIHEVDEIDDVVRHLIPKYRDGHYMPESAEYAQDIQRILSAFKTDSRKRRADFVSVLRDTAFVRAIAAFEQMPHMVTPQAAYWPTKDIRNLFTGVPGIILADTNFLPSDLVQSFETILSECGTMMALHPVSFTPKMSAREKKRIRMEAGHAEITLYQPEFLKDQDVLNLDHVLEILPHCSVVSRKEKAESLWNLLADLWAKNSSVFDGIYQWQHYGTHTGRFDVSFIKRLRETPWIIGADGALHCPSEVVFDDLGWTPHPELQERIGFKLPSIAELEEKAGFGRGVLARLKARGVTSMEDLEKIPQLASAPQQRATPEDGAGAPRREPRPVRDTPQATTAAGGTAGTRSSPSGQRTRNPGQPRTRNEGFISYVPVHPDEQDSEPNDAERQRRMDLEQMAVQLICKREPDWIVAPPNTPGYDLYMLDERREAVEWCEVKSLSGSLDDWPVSVSRTQFDFAREKGAAFWLYVVEHAGDAEQANILKIPDPAGLARTFTFDRGWRDVALKD